MTPRIEKGVSAPVRKSDGRRKPRGIWKDFLARLEPGDSFVIERRSLPAVRRQADALGQRIDWRDEPYDTRVFRRATRVWRLPQPIETRKMAVVSTSNITRRDGELIRRDGSRKFGDRHQDLLALSGDFEGRGYSLAFVALIQKLKQLNFDYALFDCDGPRIEGAPTYDW